MKKPPYEAYALFQEEIDGYALVGYFCVMISSFMLIRYEVRKRRKNNTMIAN